MANKQTLPGTIDTQRGFINTQGSPTMPTIDWKSPLKDLAEVSRAGNDFIKTYSNLRNEEYQAKYDNMANQMYHEMEDATDPCQLQDIKKRYDEAFSQPLDDTVWAKSYNKSRYKQGWMARMNLNYDKVFLNKMHEFTSIQLERTLNEMSSAAVQTKDATAAASYFDAGMVNIGNAQHLSAEAKHKMQKWYANDFVGKLMTQNPNFAVSFTDLAGSHLDKYGIDVNEVKKKADAYNKQKKQDDWTAYQRAKVLQDDMDKAVANRYKNAIITNPDKAAEYGREASLYNDAVGISVNEFIRTRESSNSQPTELQIGLSLAADKGVDEYKEYVKKNSSKIALDAKARATRDDLNKSFGIKEATNEDAEVLESQLREKEALGEKINIVDEIKTINNANISAAKKADLKKIVGNIYNNQIKESEEAEDKKNKNSSLAQFNDAKLKIGSIDSLQGLSDVYSTYAPNLTEEDKGKLIDKIYAKSENLVKEGKASAKEQKELNQDIKYIQLSRSGKYFTTDDITGYVERGEIKAEDGEKLLKNQDARIESEQKVAKENRKNSIFRQAYANADKGILTDISGYEDVLSVEDVSKIRTLNANTEKNKYTTELSRIAMQHMGNIVPEDMQRQDLITLSRIAPLGVNVEEDYRKKMLELGNAEEGILNNVKAKIDTYFTPVGKDMTDFEITQKAQAVSDILKKAREKGISDSEIMGIIKQYKPTAAEVRQQTLNETSAIYVLENQRDSLFTIGKVKDKKNGINYEKGAVSLNKGASFNDLRNYELSVNEAYANGFIDRNKYAEFSKPMMSAYESMVDNVLQKPDSVIGELAYKLRDFMYPSSDEYSLVPSEIVDYQDFYNHLNNLATILEGYGIDPDKEKTWGYKTANAWRVATGRDVNIDTSFLTAEIIFNEYVKGVFRNNGEKVVR